MTNQKDTGEFLHELIDNYAIARIKVYICAQILTDITNRHYKKEGTLTKYCAECVSLWPCNTIAGMNQVIVDHAELAIISGFEFPKDES